MELGSLRFGYLGFSNIMLYDPYVARVQFPPLALRCLHPSKHSSRAPFVVVSAYAI